MATNKYDNALKRKYAALNKAIKKREARIGLIVSDFLNSPKSSKAYWNKVSSALNKEYREIGLLYNKWAKVNIPAQYSFVIKEQMSRIKKLKSVTRKAKQSITALLKSNVAIQIQDQLYKSAVSDIAAGLALGRRDVNRLISSTRQALVNESFIDTTIARAIEAGNVRTAAPAIGKKLIEAARDNRFLTILDKNGVARRYKISDYASMVTRTKWHDAQSAAVVSTNKNYNSDLIRVSSHNTTTEICQQYEGKIMSLSGNDKRFPLADQVPPYHPNCLHYITTTFEESLKATGELKPYSDFSLGKTDAPPQRENWVPIDKRNSIVADTKSSLFKTDKYKNATTKQKYSLLRDTVSKNIGSAA